MYMCITYYVIWLCTLYNKARKMQILTVTGLNSSINLRFRIKTEVDIQPN